MNTCPIAKFLEVLHEAIQSGLRDGVDDIQINGAIQTQQGWMHIHGMSVGYPHMFLIHIVL